MDQKYLVNLETGVVFPATQHLLDNRSALNLTFTSEEDYLRQEGGRKPQEPTAPAVDPNQLTMVVEAIQGLDPSDPSHWVSGGRPDARVLTQSVGFRVTSDMRDMAWEAVLEQAEE